MSQAALEGDLGQFQPAEVLQLLQLAQATGRLELSRPAAGAFGGTGRAEVVDVFFEQGRPVFARTSGQTVRTGEILVHRGHATREADSGAAAPEQVAQAVHEGERRILYGVLLWRDGRFRFQAGERAADNDLPLDLDLDRLILEGLRLADQARAER